jgi:hypothetical protein
MSDPYSGNTVLLLRMEGANNSTTFIDSTLAKKVFTVSGNTRISTTQSKWGNGSAYFDGSGDYLTAPISGIPSSGDFTAELWVYIADYSTINNLLSQMVLNGTPIDGRFQLQITQTTGLFRLFIGAASGNLDLQTSGAVPTGQWAHLAVTRASNIFRLFINGVLQATSASYATAIASELTRVGVYINAANFTGYVQDLRITSGNARYTDNFTSPDRLPDPDPPTGVIMPTGWRDDLYDGGAYRIAGTVDELGVAGPYRVRLFDRQSARCIRETWSAADGSYSFPYIAYRPNGYFAVAYDHGDNPLNAAIADLITPESMP